MRGKVQAEHQDPAFLSVTWPAPGARRRLWKRSCFAVASPPGSTGCAKFSDGPLVPLRSAEEDTEAG